MHAIRVFTDCISRQGISCVCPSFCFHSSFWGKWPFTLSFLHWHDSRLLLESQGYGSRVRVSKVGNMVSLTSIFDWSQKWVSLIKAIRVWLKPSADLFPDVYSARVTSEWSGPEVTQSHVAIIAGKDPQLVVVHCSSVGRAGHRPPAMLVSPVTSACKHYYFH